MSFNFIKIEKWKVTVHIRDFSYVDSGTEVGIAWRSILEGFVGNLGLH